MVSSYTLWTYIVLSDDVVFDHFMFYAKRQREKGTKLKLIHLLVKSGNNSELPGS